MTIRTKEPEVPDEFPPARLFLDDIEEITRILVEVTENRQKERKMPSKITVKFSTKDKVCDEVQELPKVARKTSDLSVSVEVQDWSPEEWSPEAVLRISKHGAFLRLTGFRREQELRIFHKLAPIFKRRNLWLRTFVHSRRVVVAAVGGLSFAGAAIIPSLFRLLTHKSSTLATACGFLSLVIFVTIVTSLFHHSTVILRHSSEPSPLRQELLHKFPLVAMSSVLTFLLTLLGLYLKHKYWP